MISSGLSADLNSRVIPARGRPSPLDAARRIASAGPDRAKRILTPTTGHETRTRAKTGERREARVRFSLVKPPVGRRANQKPEEPLWNTRLATPLRAASVSSSSLPLAFSPPSPSCSPVPGPLSHFFRAPTARAGALWRRDQSSIDRSLPGSPSISRRFSSGNVAFRDLGYAVADVLPQADVDSCRFERDFPPFEVVWQFSDGDRGAEAI